jgi:hypothetical protein
LLTTNELLVTTLEAFAREFGAPARKTLKVIAWNVRPDLGVVVQLDQPVPSGAYVWLPYPRDGQTVPEISKEYPAEAGRHSNTYPSPGLGRGLPALRLFVRSEQELDETVDYVKAYRDARRLPEVRNRSSLFEPRRSRRRRRAIPRAVQREVWERDQGRCVECGAQDRLHFDHVIPFSRGGSNSVRNVQILCERCNLSKGNRI